MTNKEKAKQITNAFYIGEVSEENERIIREMLNKAALEAIQWKEKQLIDRLEDWLANNICTAHNFRGDNISATFMNDCIKSMKGK